MVAYTQSGRIFARQAWSVNSGTVFAGGGGVTRFAVSDSPRFGRYLMTGAPSLWFSTLVLCGALASFPTSEIQAQGSDARRAQATRAELEASLVEIDQILASPGYSGRVKSTRRREAELVRERLAKGDFQAGDQIGLFVQGETALTAIFTVRAGQMLVLPQIPEISLRGVLRSELKDHLTRELSRFIRDPQIDVTDAGVRIAILGQVGSPGFYTVPSDKLASEAIMQAGGPLPTANLDGVVIRRGGKTIIGEAELGQAIVSGLTLDQLNIHGGDELYVPGTKSTGTSFLTGLQIFSGVALAAFSLSRIF